MIRSTEEQEKVNNLILELNSVCNSNCIYCYLDKKNKNDPDSIKFFKNQLLEFSRQGITNVDFTGGEPTLYPGLFELARLAKDLGYRHLNLVTNGRMLSYPDYFAKAIMSGINRFVISLDGPSKEIADATTRSKGSFDETMKAIRNVTMRRDSDASDYPNCQSIELGVTIVITSLNYKYLLEIADLAISCGADFINFQHILPFIDDKHISCKKLPSSVIPRYEDSNVYLRTVLDKFGSDVKINVHFIPPCKLEGYELFILDEVSKLDRYALNYEGFGYNVGAHLRKDAFKTKKCLDCRFDKSCIGFFSSYSKELGIDADAMKGDLK